MPHELFGSHARCTASERRPTGGSESWPSHPDRRVSVSSGRSSTRSASLLGVRFGVLAIGVLGVLLIAGEYSTGMIRATMTAVPKRLPVLWGKYGAVALVLSAILRNTAAGIASFAGIMFVIPPFVSILPSSPCRLDRPVSPEQRGRSDDEDRAPRSHALARGGLGGVRRLRGGDNRRRRRRRAAGQA